MRVSCAPVMKVNIKLDKRKKGETAEGFPVVLYVVHNYKKKTVRLGYYSKVQQWNSSLSSPRSTHPKFYEINDYLLRLKSRISDIMADRLTMHLEVDNFIEQLFSRSSPVFYEEAKLLVSEGHGDTRFSALKSFNGVFPEVKIKEINRAMVEQYINAMKLKGNEPGGIDSYIRSLKALWNRVSNDPNPFKGHKIAIPTKVKRVSTIVDIQKLYYAQLSDNGPIASYSKIRDYWLLMFLFGGIDPEVLARLRYDKHIQNGRLIFNREKGGSKMPCNNIMPPMAMEILKRYDCRPYLVPIHQTGNYDSFIRNFRRGLKAISAQLELGTVMHPKSARYTFIDRAQQLLIDERITAQIVGHKRRTTTSLYTNDFPLDVQDKAHLKIVGF